MKAAIYTLGCKVNHYESQVIAEALASCGYTLAEPTEKADVYIVNSCTVTSESDRKNRQIVRRLRRQNPDGVVLLTGCMPQAYPNDAAALDEADIVLGNKSNADIPEILAQYFRHPARMILTQPHKPGDAFVPCRVNGFSDRTRAEIKIEDGCNRFCTYCAIPYARGRVRSKALADIRAEAAALGNAGYRELVLVGINLSAFSDGSADICDAVNAAAENEHVLRVRLGSLEPDHLTDDVVERLAACKKLCPQFHISLQSGCDKTLRAMNRHYTAEDYRKLCRKLRETFADCTLTTDIMVGFPGESEADHLASLQFTQEIGFEKVHVFPYSPRSGTRAANFAAQVPQSVKVRRAAEMLRETEKIRAAFLQRQIGKITDVLIETFRDGQYHEGYTANYTPVRIFGDCPDSGIVPVKITAAEKDYCIGTVKATG